MNIRCWLYQVFTPIVVQRGDAYREDLHGPTETWTENYNRIRKQTVERRASIPQSKQTIQQQNNILRSARYWDCWNGSRYVRRENPIEKMDNREYMRSEWSREGEVNKPKIKNCIVRSNPLTGDWEVL